MTTIVPVDGGEPRDWVEVSDPACLPGTPLVSVLMLAYNHGPYLGDAIESVLAQKTQSPIELLIGEDCSRDDTREIALRYQREHPSSIRVVFPTRNAGMHRNHRQLVDLSKGRYLAYCEGDDYWNERDKLERQVEFLAGNPSYGAVHSEFSHIAWRGGRWRSLPRFQAHHRDHIPEGNVLPDLLMGNFIQTCTLMARTDDVRAYLASSLPVVSYKVADWPMCLFIASRGKIGYMDQALATYRKTPGSATNLGFQADIARAMDSIRMTSDFCRMFDVPVEIELKSHCNAIEHALYSALRSGDAGSYRTAVAWLEENIPDALKPAQYRIYQRIASTPLLRFLYRAHAAVMSEWRAWRAYTGEPRAMLRVPEE